MSRELVPPTVAIIGGGVGGTVLANRLARETYAEEARLVLIDQSGHHHYQPGWLYLPFTGQDPTHLERPERSLLQHRVEFHTGVVQQLDLEKRSLVTADPQGSGSIERLHYDYLVFASGARLVPEEIPGLPEALVGQHAQQFYTQIGAQRLGQALHGFTGGHIAVAIGGLPYKCPPAPLEFLFLLEEYLQQKGLRAKTKLTYLSPWLQVFPLPSVAKLVAELLEERGIERQVGFTVREIEPGKRLIRSLAGEAVPYDLLVIVPPHRGAVIAEQSGLADARGWLPTDRTTLEVPGQEHLFALGDGADLPVPKSGAAAHFQAFVVAERIAALVQWRTVNPREGCYDGRVLCFMETGYQQATRLEFDYDHPPVPPTPSGTYHQEKAFLNKNYWHLVPPARINDDYGSGLVDTRER